MAVLYGTANWRLEPTPKQIGVFEVYAIYESIIFHVGLQSSHRASCSITRNLHRPQPMPAPDTYGDEEIAIADRDETEHPHLYKVLLHNDDYTSMDFVTRILSDIFHKSEEEAVSIMLSVHNNGTGIAGVYTKEICECKINEVHDLARELEYPLLCTMEPA